MNRYAPKVGFTLVLVLASDADRDVVLREAIAGAFEDLDESPALDDVMDGGVFLSTSAFNESVVRVTVDVSAVAADSTSQSLFADGLIGRLASNTDEVLTCACFHDWRILARNVQYAREIFHTEMAIREVLTMRAVEAGGPDAISRVMDQGTLRVQHPGADLREHGENELFYLLFSEYPTVNRRRKPDLASVLEAVSAHDSFEDFQREMGRLEVIESHGLADFLTELQQLMDPLEKVRNAVAHNRLIRDRLQGNYSMATSKLNAILSRQLNLTGDLDVTNPEGNTPL